MSRSKVIDRDLGYRDFLEAMAEFGDHSYVDVGFFEEGAGGSVHPRSGKTVVEYSAINEFGAVDEGVAIPERPHHRAAYDKNEKRYIEGIKRVVNAGIADGIKAARRALETVGEDAAKKLSETIRNTETPANAPFTVERKGFDDPLTETGKMARSTETRNSWES